MAGKSTKLEVTYNDWSGGDWGAMNGLVVARQNLPMFRGDNVQVYRNGSLGPRPGFKSLLTSGTKPTPEHSQHHFDIESFRFIDLTVGPAPGFISSLWEANISTTVAQAVNNDVSGTTFSGTPSANFTRAQAGWHVGHRIWSGAAFTGVVALPGGATEQRSCVYRDRMYYYGNSATVFYSNPAAYTTVPVGNQFTVNGSGTVSDMFVFKNTLFIVMMEGSAGGVLTRSHLFSLTGASPQSGTLAEVARNTPMGPYDAVAVGAAEIVGVSWYDGTLWVFNGTTFEFVPLTKSDPDHPPIADGYVSPISIAPISRFLQPVYIPGVDSFAIPWQSSQFGASWRSFGILERVNGSWCYSSVPGTENIGIYALAADPTRLYMKWSRAFPNSTTVYYYGRAVTLDRAPSSTDVWGIDLETFPDSPSLNSVLPWFYIPPVVAPEGSAGVQVAKVMVDLDYWTTSGAGEYPISPTISCSIAPKGYFAESTSNPLSASIAGTMNEVVASWAPTTGWLPKRRRVIFTFPKMASAGSVDILFSDLRNVAIHKVVASAEIDVQIFPGGW